MYWYQTAEIYAAYTIRINRLDLFTRICKRTCGTHWHILVLSAA